MFFKRVNRAIHFIAASTCDAPRHDHHHCECMSSYGFLSRQNYGSKTSSSVDKELKMVNFAAYYKNTKHSVVHLIIQTYEVALEYVGLMSLDNLK